MRDPQSEELLTRLQSGDERALADLANTYSSKIYQLAFRYLRNKEDAEEITQDVLYKVYRNVGTFRGDAALSSWIYRITFNAAMSRRHTARYQRWRTRTGLRRLRSRKRKPRTRRCGRLVDMADEQCFARRSARLFARSLRAPAISRAGRPARIRNVDGGGKRDAGMKIKRSNRLTAAV